MTWTKRQLIKGAAIMATGVSTRRAGAEAVSVQGSEKGMTGVALPARNIPVPKSVSPEAQAILARGNPFGSGSPEPDPADKAAWETYVRDHSDMLTRAMTPKGSPETLPKVSQHRLSQSTLYEIEPVAIAKAQTRKTLFFLHGGGFTVGGGIAAAYAAYGLAELTGLKTYSLDYRMPPQAPFPAGLDDAVEAYRFVLGRHVAKDIAVYGPSAGGGMALSCLLKARDQGLPLAAACVLHSPEADLTEAGDSFETNKGLDPLLSGHLTNSISLYANGHDLRDPYLSPLFADFAKGFPPTMLSSGTRDLFLSNTVLLHRALRRAGISADLNIWEAMGHGGFFGAAPEDRELLGEQARFIRKMLMIA